MDNIPVNLLQITDGTSNTIAVGERKTQSNNPTVNAYAALWCGIDPGLGGVVGDGAIRGQTQYRMQTGDTGTGTSGPDFGFSSMHTGGSIFLLCDGSVRFINQNISFKYENRPYSATYNKLGDRSDGGVLGNDF